MATKKRHSQLKVLQKFLMWCIIIFTIITVFLITDIFYLTRRLEDKKSTIQSEAIVIRDLRTKNEYLLEQEKDHEYLKFATEAFLYHDRVFSEIVQSVFVHAKKNRLNPFLILSIIYVESRFNPSAKSPVAYGLMQINYDVWKDELKINIDKIYDIDYNISIGCKIFKRYFDESNDISLTLYRYCNGYMTKNANKSYSSDVLQSKFISNKSNLIH